MVDATASYKDEAPSFGHGSGASASVSAASGEALTTYARHCRSALFAPAQSADWVRHWVEEVDPDALIATLDMDGRPVMSLALEVMRSGPFHIARLMGGGHANGNFPAASPQWLDKATPTAIQPLFDALAHARPDIDVVALQRLRHDFDGVPNPLLCLPSYPSPNLALAVDLDGGFDALLARASGKRKRKKHRSQTRKFEAVGGYRRIRADTPQQVHRLLDAFFAMKEARFGKMGIADVFGDVGVRAFFRALFVGALEEKDPSFVLHGLEVAGRLRAVTGSSRSGKRLICEFGTIAEDDLAHASPGDFLFFNNMEEACAQGFAIYDFSVGDEPYKRQWCDIETYQAEVLVPLTAKGRMLAVGLHQKARLKAFIKNTPAIWALAKTLRRKTAGR